MPLVNIIMPKLGEGIMEATVLRWLKKPGDWVSYDESLLEIATDKVDSEVPSTSEGYLEEILCKENDIIAIGSVIGTIRTAGTEQPENETILPEVTQEKSTIEAVTSEEKQPEKESEMPSPAYVPYQPLQQEITPKQSSSRFYSPLVMNIAASEGIDFAELASIQGTGNDGRVSKKDLLDYIEKRKSNPPAVTYHPQKQENQPVNEPAHQQIETDNQTSS
ncbi:MAG: hypothetical protein RLZZ42_1312, partial [Bacteroidota bacterium]